MVNGKTDGKQSKRAVSKAFGGDSDLKIMERMLDGLGAAKPHDDAVHLLDRFGGFGGVFTATETELVAAGTTQRVASFFCFVNPASRRIAASGGDGENIVSEAAAMRSTLTLLEQQNKPGSYAIYTDGRGRKIRSEFAGEEGAISVISGAALGACRHTTRKLLLIRYRPDDDVRTPSARIADALSKLMRLLEILDMEFIDFIETDGEEFFSLRRAAATSETISKVSDADSTPYTDCDFLKVLEKYGAKIRKPFSGKTIDELVPRRP